MTLTISEDRICLIKSVKITGRFGQNPVVLLHKTNKNENKLHKSQCWRVISIISSEREA